MSVKWIVVVNRVNARIFSEKRMSLIAEFKHELGRAKNREMTTGRPGVGRNRTGAKSSTHNLTGKKNPHEEAAVTFAKKVGAYLAKQASLGRVGCLVIAAEPRMMGYLKPELGRKLDGRTEWIRKDLGKLKAHELKHALGAGGKVWPADSVSNF